MEHYISLCDNTIRLIVKYYESIKHFEETIFTSSTDLYTYFDDFPDYEESIGSTSEFVLIYNGKRIMCDSKDNSEILSRYSLLDLYFIMNECLTIITPSFAVGRQHGNNGSHCGYIKPPYDAIKGTIRLLEKMIYEKNDQLTYDLAMMEKHSKLKKKYAELETKYKQICSIISDNNK